MSDEQFEQPRRGQALNDDRPRGGGGPGVWVFVGGFVLLVLLLGFLMFL